MLKFAPLVWAGIWRKKLRTILTVLTITVAFTLFGMLRGFLDGFNATVDSLENDVLNVYNRTLRFYGLPIAHHAPLKEIEGVQRVAHFSGINGYYQNPNQRVFANAISSGPDWFGILDEYKTSDETLDAFARSRTGAIVGVDLMEELGLSVDDRFPIVSDLAQEDGSTTWDFEIVGTWYTEQSFPSRFFFVRFDYLDEARAGQQGLVWGYFAKVADADEIGAVAKRIDDAFLNSTVPVRSESQKDGAKAFLGRIGNVEFFVNAIVGSAFFTIIFVTGGTMMQSIRERVPEFAVLKSFGYRSPTVSAIAIAESILVCLIGAGIGLGFAYFALPRLMTLNMEVQIPASVFVTGGAIAVVMGAMSAALPALHVHRASVVDALAGR